MGSPSGGKQRVALSLLAITLAVGLGLTIARPGPAPQTVHDTDAGSATPRAAERTSERIAIDGRVPAPEITSESDPAETGTAEAASPPQRRHAGDPSLDRASRTLIERRLGEAIERARADRRVRISEGLVDRIIDDGSVRILVAQSDDRPDLEARLEGTRHDAAHAFAYVPFVALEVGPQALFELVESSDVLGIEEDRRNEPSLLTTIPLISADSATAAGFDGSGRVIVLLDTGVDTSHPALVGRLVDEACFSRDGHCPGGGTREFGPGAGAPCNFGCGHGTLVAGAALSLDLVAGRNGVAPDARFISIQVYSNDGGTARAWTSDIIAGLEHAYALRAFHPIAAVNLSLGGDPFNSTAACDAANAARKAAIDLLRGVGIASIASAGNDGFTDLISEPACISTAISVGGTTKADAIAGFSNSARFLSLLAPGALVQTTHHGGGFVSASGTSIATPHVAGAWAAILEAVPGSNVAEVAFALQSTGRPLLDARNGVTTSRIDVSAAITALDAGIDIPDIVGGPGVTGQGTGTTSGDSGSACGLVGLEVLTAWMIVRWGRHRSRRA
jgi:subtilisin family serine protease